MDAFFAHLKNPPKGFRRNLPNFSSLRINHSWNWVPSCREKLLRVKKLQNVTNCVITVKYLIVKVLENFQKLISQNSSNTTIYSYVAKSFSSSLSGFSPLSERVFGTCWDSNRKIIILKIYVHMSFLNNDKDVDEVINKNPNPFIPSWNSSEESASGWIQ